MTDVVGWSVSSTDGATPLETDGRRLRKAANREAVVDALLDLYAEGNLRPSTDAIAERAGISPRSLFRYFEDIDDLADEAITRQLARAVPLVGFGVRESSSFEERIAAVIDQRFRIFEAFGPAAQVARLRAPFQPRLAQTLAESRQFLREQLRSLFAGELATLGDDGADAALAAADVLATFEAYQLLTVDQGRSVAEARTIIGRSLSVLLSPGGTP